MKKLLLSILVLFALSCSNDSLNEPQLDQTAEPINNFGELNSTLSPNATLVAYWKFDEGSGTVANDSSSYGNNGTLMNGPTWVDGISGKALSFDGVDDSVKVPDSDSLDIQGPLTIMAWLYPRRVPLWFESFVNKYLNYMFQTTESGTGLRLTFVDHAIDSPDNILKVNEWQHVAGVWDGNYFRLYVNGIEIANQYEGPATPPASSYPLFIGCEGYHSQDCFWQYFDGLIDEVKVYNRALSAEMVKAEFEILPAPTPVPRSAPCPFPPPKCPRRDALE